MSAHPMQGNTISAVNGYKKPALQPHPQGEPSFFEVHRAEGTHRRHPR